MSSMHNAPKIAPPVHKPEVHHHADRFEFSFLMTVKCAQ